MSLPYPENIELNPDEPLPEWMLAAHAVETDDERLLDMIIDSMSVFDKFFSGMDRKDAKELLAAFEENGLKLILANEDV
jgi:hypothetical protein